MQQTWLEALFRAWYVVSNQTKDLSYHSRSNLAAPCRQSWIWLSPVCLKSCEGNCLSMHNHYYVFKFGSITICIKMWLSLVPLIWHLFPQSTPCSWGLPANSSVFGILPLFASHQSLFRGLLKIICCSLLFIAFCFGVALLCSDGHQTETLCMLYAWQMFYPRATPQLSV